MSVNAGNPVFVRLSRSEHLPGIHSGVSAPNSRVDTCEEWFEHVDYRIKRRLDLMDAG